MTTSLTFGEILFTTDQDTEAWKHIERALMNASDLGDCYLAALSLEYMGYGYLRRGDYQNSYGAYETGAEKYSDTKYNGPAKICEENMANIRVKKRNPDAIVGFYKPNTDIDETLFYPPVQSSASEPPTSHS